MLSKILIVHRSPIIIKLISSYTMAEFQNVAIDKTLASNEALERLVTDRYDVIISGIEMAPPDGFELNRLKKEIELNAQTPMVLITSNRSENQKHRLAGEGIEHYIFSPFSGKELAQVLEGALNPRAKREYDRYGLSGAEAVMRIEGAPRIGKVINISLRGMLIEMEYEDGFMAPWSPISLDIVFPEDFRQIRIENVTALPVRQEALERREDHRPKTLRLAFMFPDLSASAEKTMKKVLDLVDRDVIGSLEELELIS